MNAEYWGHADMAALTPLVFIWIQITAAALALH